MPSLKDIEGRKVCGNCGHGRFEMTSHTPPRFKMEEGEAKVGECHFDLRPIYEAFTAQLPLVLTKHYARIVVPDMSYGLEYDDCEDCPCWIPQDGEEQNSGDFKE
ncbi:hypothetical protein [Desulfovibrio ferrophilus]|uniref:Phosphorylase n=1 Tax=Desulfovibrio ferrophilus TaxID=241368 RepID=A0A2Z6B3U9_9BACT|nr:hypothetical protein [Desulfovibrio ferrophilus]BBD10118.1 phosphorylase [Desulfovibrio ferrophilus]